MAGELEQPRCALRRAGEGRYENMRYDRLQEGLKGVFGGGLNPEFCPRGV